MQYTCKHIHYTRKVHIPITCNNVLRWITPLIINYHVINHQWRYDAKNLNMQVLNPIKGAVFASKRHVLDNKILDSIKALIKYTCQLELVPLHCHSCNGSRSGHQSLQTTFPQHLIQGGDTLPQITIETSPPACWADPKSPPPSKHHSQSVCPILYIWAIKLQ